MTVTVEATVENGQLKLKQPLLLTEGTAVQVTVTPLLEVQQKTKAAAIVPCQDPALIEWAAMDPDLEFPAAEKP